LRHIERSWSRISSEDGGRKNNATEGIIGLAYQFRTRTTRSFKNIDKLLAIATCRSFCEVVMDCENYNKCFDSRRLGLALKKSPTILGMGLEWIFTQKGLTFLIYTC